MTRKTTRIAALGATLVTAVVVGVATRPPSAKAHALHACEAFLDAGLGDPYETAAARGRALAEAAAASRQASEKDPRWHTLDADLNRLYTVARAHGFDKTTNVSVLAPATDPSEIATLCQQTGMTP